MHTTDYFGKSWSTQNSESLMDQSDGGLQSIMPVNEQISQNSESLMDQSDGGLQSIMPVNEQISCQNLQLKKSEQKIYSPEIPLNQGLQKKEDERNKNIEGKRPNKMTELDYYRSIIDKEAPTFSQGQRGNNLEIPLEYFKNLYRESDQNISRNDFWQRVHRLEKRLKNEFQKLEKNENQMQKQQKKQKKNGERNSGRISKNKKKKKQEKKQKKMKEMKEEQIQEQKGKANELDEYQEQKWKADEVNEKWVWNLGWEEESELKLEKQRKYQKNTIKIANLITTKIREREIALSISEFGQLMRSNFSARLLQSFNLILVKYKKESNRYQAVKQFLGLKTYQNIIIF